MERGEGGDRQLFACDPVGLLTTSAEEKGGVCSESLHCVKFNTARSFTVPAMRPYAF